jgi:flagellar basal body rod protein FlgC
MTDLLSISASGLAASAAKLSTAAGKIAGAFVSRPEPSNPRPQPVPSASPATAPAAAPLAPSTVMPRQDGAVTGVVGMIEASAAYRANIAVFKTANKLAQATVSMLG